MEIKEGNKYVMIREFRKDDLEAVMALWLKTNKKAHDFIPESYWEEHYEKVKGMLPEAKLLVYEKGSVIQGFAGCREGYIAGIFVDREYQSQGAGKALLDCVKEGGSSWTLHVYKKNRRAVQFYQREAFVIVKEQVDEGTGEIELVMNWRRDAVRHRPAEIPPQPGKG